MTRSLSWTTSRVDREVRAGDRGQRRGKPVHVVEEVEGVRDAHEPDERDDDRDDVVREQLDVEAAGDDDPGGGELCQELAQRPEAERVVDEPGDEDHRAAAEDPEQLRRRLEHAGENGCGDADDEAAVDPDRRRTSASSSRASARRSARPPAACQESIAEALGSRGTPPVGQQE